MRIAINARSILLSQPTGIGRYTYHLIDSLGAVDPVNQYWLYVQKKFWDTKRKLPKFSYSNFSVKNDFFGRGAQQCLKDSDIYHSPSPELLSVVGSKIVVTIHDLIYKTYPQGHTSETIDLTNQYMSQIVKRADHIICISQNTRDDLHRFFDFPEGRSSVIYNGVNHQKFYCLEGMERQEAKSLLVQLGVFEPFLLFVGTIEPRKNLSGLLEAFSYLRQKKQFNGKLVVVGMKGWMTESIAPLIERLGIKEEVVFLGFVSDDQLRVLYNFSEVFVFPSFYEGFGFPIVEAFCCGAAVVTANTSSCGEIAADAAFCVNPEDIIQMAEGITQLLENKKFNQDLRQKGLLRAKEFSFLKNAQQTGCVYEEVRLES
ncbi:MAG: glycosyltransferase family 4 protein [Candidatus Omnitrophica bacterium]|nr:glycosyltransferase family 4 protein [Candidatus Omnitrophota bacterium]